MARCACARSHPFLLADLSLPDALQNSALSLSLRRMASAKPSALLDTRVIYCGDNGTVSPRCVELARVLKKTGSFYYHCDWHASH